jgi:hypothetical protein
LEPNDRPGSEGFDLEHPQTTRKVLPVLLVAWVALACAYVTFIPVGNNFFLYPLLVSLAILAGIGIWRDGATVRASLLLPGLIWFCFVIFGSAVGIARGAEVWPRTLVFFLIWPVIFSVIVIGFRLSFLRIIFFVGAIATVIIGLLFILEGLSAFGYLPFSSLPTWITEPIGLYPTVDQAGTIAMASWSMPPLIWWGPIWLASLAVKKGNPYLPPIWLRFLAGAFAIAGTLVTWRRAIVVVLLLAPVIILVAWLILRMRNQAASNSRLGYGWAALRIAACYVLAVGLTIGAQPQIGQLLGGIVSSVASAAGLRTASASQLPSHAATVVPPRKSPPAAQKPSLVLTPVGTATAGRVSAPAPAANATPAPAQTTPPLVPTNEGVDRKADRIRSGELKSLTTIRGPIDAIFGRGFGAYIVREIPRPRVRPWQTELQYHGLFYWTGIVGLLLLAATLLASLRAVREAFRLSPESRGVLFISTVGAFAILIANGTNPYLQAPGHMWPIFLPLMITSAVLAKSSSSRGLHFSRHGIRIARASGDGSSDG